MTTTEHTEFWTDVSAAARAIEAVFDPVHLNFQILGNQDPHVHAHVIPRYDPDPAPSMPLPPEAWEASVELEPNVLKSQLDALRSHIETTRTEGSTPVR